MATRGKHSRTSAPARKARRPAPRKNTARRGPAPQAKRRQAERAARRSRAESAATSQVVASSSSRRTLRPIVRMAAGWSTLRVVWRPAIAMATLPYRVYRVYRWAEAESHRTSGIGAPATT